MAKPTKTRKPNKVVGNKSALDALTKALKSMVETKNTRTTTKANAKVNKLKAKAEVINAKNKQKLGAKVASEATKTLVGVSGQQAAARVEIAKANAEARRREIDKWNAVINGNSEPAEGTNAASEGYNNRTGSPKPAGNPAK